MPSHRALASAPHGGYRSTLIGKRIETLQQAKSLCFWCWRLSRRYVSPCFEQIASQATGPATIPYQPPWKRTMEGCKRLECEVCPEIQESNHYIVLGCIYGFLQRCGSLYGTGIDGIQGKSQSQPNIPLNLVLICLSLVNIGPRAITATATGSRTLNSILSRNFVLAQVSRNPAKRYDSFPFCFFVNDRFVEGG